MLDQIDTQHWEISLLGCAVQNYNLDAQEALSLISPDMLRYQEPRILYAAIQRCRSNGQEVDPMHVYEAIELMRADLSLGRFTEILHKEAMGSANIKAYASRIMELHRLNSTLALIKQAEQAILDTRDTRQALESVKAIMGQVDLSEGKEPRQLDAVLSEYFDHQMAVYEGRATQGQMLGMAGVADAFGPIGETDLIVVAGRPGMGKTQCALTVASDIALERNKPVLFFSLEMDDTQIAERVLLAEAGLSVDDVNNGRAFEEDTPAALMGKAARHIQGKPFFISQSVGVTVDDIAIQARKFAKRHPNTGAVIVDYLGLIKFNGNMRHDLAIAEITGGLKRLAQEIKVPIICLAQLNRGLEQRQDKRPVMADLRDSGAIEQDADKIVFVYRDAVYDSQTPMRDTIELINGKRRRGEPQNGYCHFRNGHIKPMTMEGQVWAQNMATEKPGNGNNSGHRGRGNGLR
ncbi:replicative DNA helicase [Oceanisphaera sp. KMM 10153]|uniref:replicative DNA helicase n=1 Tax=Oceanisphaera submarina TaxID=3390193 RepID=UPI00397497AA